MSVVEVGRTHGEPAVIDDRDIGVHVERLGAAGIVAVDGHREQPTCPVVGLEQAAELAAGGVGTVVRLGRQKHVDENLRALGGP